MGSIETMPKPETQEETPRASASTSSCSPPDPAPAEEEHPLLIEAEDDDPLFADLPEGATLATFIAPRGY